MGKVITKYEVAGQEQEDLSSYLEAEVKEFYNHDERNGNIKLRRLSQAQILSAVDKICERIVGIEQSVKMPNGRSYSREELSEKIEDKIIELYSEWSK